MTKPNPKTFPVWVNDREKIILVKSLPQELSQGYVRQKVSINSLMQLASKGYKIG